MCLAIPGKIIRISGTEPLERRGSVSFGGAVRQVALACVPQAEVGDYVLVHVGLAISLIDEAEARRVFEYLAEMDDLAELDSEELLGFLGEHGIEDEAAAGDIIMAARAHWFADEDAAAASDAAADAEAEATAADTTE